MCNGNQILTLFSSALIGDRQSVQTKEKILVKKTISGIIVDHGHCQNIHYQSQNRCFKNFLIFGEKQVSQSARKPVQPVVPVNCNFAQ